MENQTTEKEFLTLVEAHQGILHKVCNMYCDSAEDRRDLFQEIMGQLWRSYQSFEQRSKFTTWAYRVALNTAISHFRKQRRTPRLGEINEEAIQLPAYNSAAEAEERSRILYKAIDQLSKVERAIILLYMDELSYQEMSEILGITPTNIGVKILRIKTKLKKILTPYI